MPATGRLAIPARSSSSTPTMIYPPPRLSKSLAKAQIVRYILSGFQPFLNSMRLDSILRLFNSSSMLMGIAIVHEIIGLIYLSFLHESVHEHQLPKVLLYEIASLNLAANHLCTIEKLM